ncbi:MAG: hypothetical protein CGW95_12200 [Phenylobacterium zucineum]|nr:MAG: hypothetical protein CGW95_12200 [Phenylobacterium zucineum]
MKAMTAEQVKRMALAHGGKLELDGKAVNAARLQVATKPAPEKAAYMPPEPKPAPLPTIESKPDPAVREAVQSIDQYAASQFLLNESNIQLMQTVKEMLHQVSAAKPDARPTKWVFRVKRDAQGLMETITATAT